MRSNFQTALTLVLEEEGGYVNHPRDPGGATNQGITQGTYNDYLKARGRAHRPVRQITPAEIRTIYRSRYWNKVRGDKMPLGLDYMTFDAAVNSGVSRGAKWTQKALGVKADGHIGEKTLAAAAAVTSAGEDSLVATIKKATSTRLGFLRGLSHWRTFGLGWTRRVSRVEAGAIGMVAGTRTLRAEAAKATKAVRNEVVRGAGGAAGAGAAVSQMPEWASYAVGAVLIIAAALIARRVIVTRNRSRVMRQVADQLDQMENPK